MRQRLEVVLVNQRQINNRLFMLDGDGSYFSARLSRGLLKVFNEQREALQNHTRDKNDWSNYQESFSTLSTNLENLYHDIKSKQYYDSELAMKKKLYQLTLVTFGTLLHSATTYLKKVEGEQQDVAAAEILGQQKKVAWVMKDLGLHLKLNYQSFIELSNFQSAYNQIKGQGSAVNSFFYKSIGQGRVIQDFRDEALQFIVDVDEYLESRQAEFITIERKQRMRLSAMSLVRIQIGSEYFGEADPLYCLIKERLKAAAYPDDDSISGEFIKDCKDMGIKVPEKLENYFETLVSEAIQYS